MLASWENRSRPDYDYKELSTASSPQPPPVLEQLVRNLIVFACAEEAREGELDDEGS